MENSKWDKQELVSLKGSPKIIISEQFLDRIQFLCSNINKVEWSGVLFYDVEGSIKHPNEMIITLREIFLMDKGTAGETTFKYSHEVSDFIMEYDDLADCYRGLIHSHNTMDVFYSGTDWDELRNNSDLYSFYLSVVVNNFMEMVGKIVFVAKSTAKEVDYMAKDEDGNKYIISNQTVSIPDTMYAYDCEILRPAENLVVPDFFKERLSLIEERAEERIKKEDEERKRKLALAQQSKTSHTVQNGYQNSNGAYSGYHKNISSNTAPSNRVSTYFEDNIIDMAAENDIIESTSIVAEQFAAFLMNLGNSVPMGMELEDILEGLESTNISGQDMAESIVESYTAFYTKYFNIGLDDADIKEFSSMIDEVVAAFEFYEEDYPDLLTSVIMGLKSFSKSLAIELQKA